MNTITSSFRVILFLLWKIFLRNEIRNEMGLKNALYKFDVNKLDLVFGFFLSMRHDMGDRV